MPSMNSSDGDKVRYAFPYLTFSVLVPEKGRSCKQKTAVCRKTLNPNWNYTMHFDDVSLQDLIERSLEIAIWDHDRLGPSQYLGGCRLNLGRGSSFGRPVEWMDATGMERLIWEHMLEKVDLWVESSIMLRSYIDRPVYPIEPTPGE
ncbi:C2 domain [Trinorchestia longiramus]|nr:C2 domain [Trinorchestia longiramus]